MSHVHAFSCIHTFIYPYIDIDIVGAFLRLSLSLSLSLILALVYSMAPKRKSTLSQNHLRFGASTSSNSTPSYLWFHDDKARSEERRVGKEC